MNRRNHAKQCCKATDLKLQVSERYLLNVAANCGVRYHCLSEVQPIQRGCLASVIQPN